MMEIIEFFIYLINQVNLIKYHMDEYTLDYVLYKQYLIKFQKELDKRNKIFEYIKFRFIGPTGLADDDYRPERQNFRWKNGYYIYDGNY